jgi:hypothetical protein
METMAPPLIAYVTGSESVKLMFTTLLRLGVLPPGPRPDLELEVHLERGRGRRVAEVVRGGGA